MKVPNVLRVIVDGAAPHLLLMRPTRTAFPVYSYSIPAINSFWDRKEIPIKLWDG